MSLQHLLSGVQHHAPVYSHRAVEVPLERGHAAVVTPVVERGVMWQRGVGRGVVRRWRVPIVGEPVGVAFCRKKVIVTILYNLEYSNLMYCIILQYIPGAPAFNCIPE